MNNRLWSFRRLAGAFALVLFSLLVGQGAALAQTRISLTELQAQIDAADQAIAQLQQVTTALQAQVTAQGAVIAQLQSLNQALEAKVFCISPNSTSTQLRFVGCNVHIVNGQGSTQTQNGLGNLIVGYNEDAATLANPPSIRTGSHNIVTGIGHSYTSSGGLVAGRLNKISGLYATVSGGSENSATAANSSVTGGKNNTASQVNSTVSGGEQNQALGAYSSVTAGYGNRATNAHATVGGGMSNVASGQMSSVSGGQSRTAAGDWGWTAGTLP